MTAAAGNGDRTGAGEQRPSPLSLPGGPALGDWLAGNLDGHAPYDMAPIQTASTSNEMWEVSDADGRRWALRSPPAVKNAPTAHDVGREFRLLRALDGTDVPHPSPTAICRDDALLGRPFYVMAHVDGVVLQAPLPGWAQDPGNRGPIGTELVAAVAALGSVDWRNRGLDGFGKPEGFLERQVNRWLGQLARYQARDLPGLEELAGWLRQQQAPAQPSAILHGDYSLFNVLFSRTGPRLTAVVDWETATIGDPLVDLGWLVAQWSEPGEPPVIETGITHLEGMAGRSELVAEYARLTGRDTSAIAYYAALASFKLACIVEGAWYRFSRGQTTNPRHARFERLVPRLIQHALSISRGEWI
jgi:aminoglycoside phosphotransferase (APT) family kinase protein